MACKRLLTEYVKETGKTLPALESTEDIKKKWLLSEDWKCYVGTRAYNLSSCYAIDGTSTSDPVYKLNEDGFLPWINERGRKCINHVTGEFYQTVKQSDGSYVYQSPGITTTPSSTHECWAECMHVSRGSPTTDKECVTCIMNYLQTNPSACVSPITKNEMLDSLVCQQQIAQEILDSTQTVRYDKIWYLFKQGTPKPALVSRGTLLGICLGVVAALIIALVILSAWLHRRIKVKYEEHKSRGLTHKAIQSKLAEPSPPTLPNHSQYK
jgi:hypothetical protein